MMSEEKEMRTNTGSSHRHRSDHTQSSHGPLSSIKAVIKRTKPSFQSDRRRGNYRRRPEITIVSAEPLDCSKHSPSGPLIFSAPHTPPPQVGWTQPSQRSPKVPKQKTHEVHIKPVAPPRNLNCTSTTTTTTPAATTTATTTFPKTSGKKPQKPPRPSAPKNKKTSTTTAGPTDVNLTFAPPHDNKDSDSNEIRQNACTRSVTVHWNNTTSTKTSSDTTATTATTTTISNCPVPLPRIKSKRPLIRPEEPQTLVQLSDNSDTSNCIVDSVSSNKYLEELLEVFNAENLEIFYHSSAEIEDADEMSATNSLRAKIQAFESQAEASEPVKPTPQARKTRPPVAAKPSVSVKPQFSADDLYDNVSSPPTPAPKPPPKPLGKRNSVKEELNAVLAQHRFKPPMLTREDSIYDEDFAKTPPTPPVKPVKEPLKPNLNINNHNNYTAWPVYDDVEDAAKGSEEATFSEYEYEYEYVDRQPSEGSSWAAENMYVYPERGENDTSQGPETESLYEYVEFTPSKAPEIVTKTYEEKPPNILPVRPKPSMDSHAGSRQSLTRRPTTIIVPRKSDSFSDSFQDSAPPLPVQRPVGALKAPPAQPQHSVASFPPQVSHSPIPEPSLPPRRLTTSKTLPPRPSLVRSGPGRPPPPRMEAAGRSQSIPWDSAPKPQAQRPPQRGPVLPPRPNPGHRLYNKYTLQIPHAVASTDYNGSNNGELSFQKNEVLVLLNPVDANTYECQVGDRRGRVHRSSMKVITPLSTEVSAAQGGNLTASGNGLTVEVLHDFNPENPGELGLKAGDVVTMVEQVDSEWYRGTCRGSSGFFPINYVKVLANSPRLPDRTSKKPSPTVSGPRCVGRFDFEGECSDELSFSEGDVIQLKAYVGQEWARGQLGASTGIFPLAFVEVIEDLPPATIQQPTKPTKIALPGMSKTSLTQVTPQAQSGSEWAVALYDFSGTTDGDLSFEKGDRILITKHFDEEWSGGRLNGREGIFPRAFVTSTTADKTSPTTSHQNGSNTGVSAKALYDFESDCDEELSLKVGDVITNIESVSNEWFLGDLGGKRAMVPKNYVEIL